MKREQRIIKKQLEQTEKELDTLLDVPIRNMPLIQNQVKKISTLNRHLSTLKSHSLPKIEPWMHNPALRDIMEKMSPVAKLKCPVCGESDHGNTLNERPWCFKCNTPLVAKAEKSTMKVLSDKIPSDVTFTKFDHAQRR